jgi:hypothetical protein
VKKPHPITPALANKAAAKAKTKPTGGKKLGQLVTQHPARPKPKPVKPAAEKPTPPGQIVDPAAPPNSGGHGKKTEVSAP